MIGKQQEPRPQSNVGGKKSGSPYASGSSSPKFRKIQNLNINNLNININFSSLTKNKQKVKQQFAKGLIESPTYSFGGAKKISDLSKTIAKQSRDKATANTRCREVLSPTHHAASHQQF